MVVKDNVSIQERVKKIFRETYGVEDDELYRNNELREKIRNAVKTLRDSYKGSVCVTDYTDEDIRKAYMIAYYPYYIEPARYVVKNFVAPYMSQRKTLCLDFLASGPCPELLGTVLALRKTERCNRVKVQTYDSEQGWFPYQQLTFNFAQNILEILPPAVLLKHSGDLTETDILFLQNFLSHLKYQSVNYLLDRFSSVITRTKQKTFFVFIDLGYYSVAAVFNGLVNNDFLSKNNLKKISAHIPADGEPLTISHGDTTQSLLDNIFNGEDGFRPKKNTHFYFVVLQKI